jgi:hypothetical protein
MVKENAVAGHPLVKPIELPDIACEQYRALLEVSEPELVEAIGIYSAVPIRSRRAPLAALLKEGARMEGRRVGLIMTGQNIDRPVMLAVLAGQMAISLG